MNNLNKNQWIGLSPNSKKIKIYKSTLTNLSPIQFETMIGLMLGDASLQIPNKGKTYRVKFEWGNKNKPYLDHVYSLLEEWVLSLPHKKTRVSSKGNIVVHWGFQTISHTALLSIADLFIKGTNVITKDLIMLHLTSRGLAYWFMDDGGKLDYNKNSKNTNVVLNT